MAPPSSRSQGISQDSCRRGWDTWIGLFVFAFVLAAHFASRNITSWDSWWTIPTAVSIVTKGDTDLNEYESRIDQRHYHLVRVNGYWHSRYPIGPALVAVPFVAVVDAGYRVFCGYGLQEFLQTDSVPVLEEFIACFVVAATAGLIYRIARWQRLPAWQALLATFIFAFANFAAAGRCCSPQRSP